MRTIITPVMFMALALLSGCGEEPTAPKPVVAGELAIEAWSLPAMPGSAQPDLSVAPDGRLLLSWINVQPGRRPAFQFAEYRLDGLWDTARTIAVGNSMFVNWADTPHIVATADRALWAHWLQKSADAPYAYDIMLVRSLDHGMNWSAPRKAHGDDTRTEHGFVSMWAQDNGSLGMAWLDGRNSEVATQTTAQAGHSGKHDDGHDGGTMSLRAAVFDANLRASAETELDAMTCDCCQTDVAVTAKGAVLVYRDRSENEIRDIYAARFDGSTWSKPARVHADEWKMPACPVNGPSVAADDDAVVVAWYTVSGDVPTVKLSRSPDGGATFGKPLSVDTGAAVQGRVAVALDARQVWLLWLREEAGKQSLWLARYAPDLSKELQRTKIADVQGSGRGSGFAKLALRAGAAHVVWTDVIEGRPQLTGLRLILK
jgi:hypothetical protein